MPMEEDDDFEEKEQKCQLEVERQRHLTSAVMDLFRERLASERLVTDQIIDQVEKDSSAEQAEAKASARNTQKKERDRFD